VVIPTEFRTTLCAMTPEDGRHDDNRTAHVGTEPIRRRQGPQDRAIGLISSIVIAVASTAPAYSLTSALGSIVGEVGTHAPIIVLLAFVPMLFISYAYQALNNVDPDCGTSFTWVARAT
jgi:hypothetical protein